MATSSESMATAAAASTTNTPADATETPERKLSDIFEEAYYLYNGLDQLDVQQNTSEFQLELRKCSVLLEDATRLVSAVGLFSDNELEDEIATAHIKYLLLPYFLGQLVQKKTAGSGGPDRKEIVAVAQVYFKDFLARCESYSLHQAADQTVAVLSARSGGPDKMAELTQMAHQRNTKLEQYRAKKELDEEIKKIKVLMEREHIDDGLRREFYLKLVRASCVEAVDELRSLAQEAQMLDMMGDPTMRRSLRDEQGADGASASCSHSHGHSHNHRKPSAPLKPVIITKDAFQKAVYGAGYPSLPTMSVDDFYENRVAAGIFPDPTVRRDPNSVQARAMRGEATELDEEQDIQKEEDEQNDDEVYLARARAMDEFKDDVRRGDGNRHNRS